MKKLIFVCMLMLLTGMSFAARKALVIGNGQYAAKSLKNPANDAELMKKTLTSLDFSVVKLINADAQTFLNAVRDFANDLELDDEVVFYYSGHGIQLNGENYLLPVGESYEDTASIENNGINLGWVTSKLSSTAITMVFLDACRDNPYTKSHSSEKGLATAEPNGENVLMMYSTDVGAVTNEGKGNNSDFTLSLANQISKPGLTLEEVSTNITAEVRELTNNAQRPWKTGSLEYKYYFIPPEGGQANSRSPYSKYPSTVEDRLSSKKNKAQFYSPKASKYFNVLLANEFLINEDDNLDYTYGQYVTRNIIGMKLPYAGIEVFYNVIKTWQNADFSSGVMLKQYGAGAGLPNMETARLFAYIVQNDFSSLSPYEDFLGFKAQAAKRVRSEKQFSELGLEFDYNKVPWKFNPTEFQPQSVYFDENTLTWTPHIKFGAYLLASSLNNRYLESNSFRGLGPATSPLLLANCQANAFIARLTVEQSETKFVNGRDVTIDCMLPLNFGKVLGTDIGYTFKRSKDFSDNSSADASVFSGGVRISFLTFEPFRLIGSAEYRNAKATATTESIYLGAHAIIKISHHFAAMCTFKHNTLWQRNIGFAEIDPEGYFISSAITVRL